jgi:hypothetical protein
MSNMDNFDLQALDRDLQEFARQQKQRGWWSRNWLWFVPTLLLTMVVFCCGCPAGIFFFVVNAVYDQELFKDAMAKIEANDVLKKELGQPITIVRWPPPAFSMDQTNGSGEADIRWEVEGPKGRAKAHVHARLTDNRWEVKILEVVLPNGKKVSLADEAGGVEDAPVFEAPKPGATKPEETGPAPEINMPTFDEEPQK